MGIGIGIGIGIGGPFSEKGSNAGGGGGSGSNASGSGLYCFEVISPDERYILRATTETDFGEWLDVLRLGIASQLAHNTPGGSPLVGKRNALGSTGVGWGSGGGGGGGGGIGGGGGVGVGVGVGGEEEMSLRDELWIVPGNDRCADCGQKGILSLAFVPPMANPHIIIHREYLLVFPLSRYSVPLGSPTSILHCKCVPLLMYENSRSGVGGAESGDRDLRQVFGDPPQPRRAHLQSALARTRQMGTATSWRKLSPSLPFEF
jgi:hypothetical protein